MQEAHKLNQLDKSTHNREVIITTFI